MYTQAYIIETITNTHMGSGDTSFGVVDNLIQKDPVTSLPVFHGSSLKGAIKEHMQSRKLDPNDMKRIFGSDRGNLSDADNPGQVKFYEARLLTLPLRASKRVYYQCTSTNAIFDCLDTFIQMGIVKEESIKELKEFFSKLSLDDDEFCIFNSELSDLEIEDYTKGRSKTIGNGEKEQLSGLTGCAPDCIAVFRDDLFKEICEVSLPVIARNCIGADGISENLFYEEILPRRAKLWFMIGYDQRYTSFEKFLAEDVIQVGANASIGYGAVKFYQMKGIG